MTDVTKLSNEKLIVKGYEMGKFFAHGLPQELASRLEATLERERLDVEAMKTHKHGDWAWCVICERLVARETKG